MTAAAAPPVLPALRDELTLHPGPVGRDGAPTWTLHDPQSNRFFRLSWPVFEVLTRWHLNDPEQIAQSVNQGTTLDMDAEEVVSVVEFLARSQLLKPTQITDTARLIALHDAHKTSLLTWLLHHYLFFRIPLVRPNALLDQWFPLVSWLGSRAFRLTTLAALLLGLFLVGRQWGSFSTTLVDHFSLPGLIAFGIALGFAKVLHELGHAFTAKNFGCRVPTMGVAFLVMMPMLYTDVTEAWQISDNRKRLLVSAAGILSELTLAAWATLAWGLLPDGTAREMAFTLAATTWISSLAINLSPFMRFDGYFLVMDALDQPNLHARSFALARWHLRETLFGLGEPVPEYLPRQSRVWMILFAWAVWIYRLTLFLGIAVLVYHFFIKIVGIVLFCIEIGWFLVMPIVMEIKEWVKRAQAIRLTRRSRLTFSVVAVLLIVTALPWNGRVTAPALLKASQHTAIYVPSPARLTEVLVKDGDRVTAGQVLVRFDNPDLGLKMRKAQVQAGSLRYQLTSMGFVEVFRDRAQAITKELSAALAQETALSSEQDRLTLTAPFDGIVTDLSDQTQPGQWINPNTALLGLRAGAEVEAYVTEDDIPRLAVGAAANFIPEVGGTRLQAQVASIEPAAVAALTEPSLAVPFGGTIPARFDRKTLVPDSAIYRVRLRLTDPAASAAVPLRGQAHLDGERRSLLGHALRSVAAVFLREWGT